MSEWIYNLKVGDAVVHTKPHSVYANCYKVEEVYYVNEVDSLHDKLWGFMIGVKGANPEVHSGDPDDLNLYFRVEIFPEHFKSVELDGPLFEWAAQNNR